MNWPAFEQGAPNGQVAERLCLCLLTPQPTILQTSSYNVLTCASDPMKRHLGKHWT